MRGRFSLERHLASCHTCQVGAAANRDNVHGRHSFVAARIWFCVSVACVFARHGACRGRGGIVAVLGGHLLMACKVAAHACHHMWVPPWSAYMPGHTVSLCHTGNAETALERHRELRHQRSSRPQSPEQLVGAAGGAALAAAHAGLGLGPGPGPGPGSGAHHSHANSPDSSAHADHKAS